MIAALTFLIGFQLMLSFLNYDISSSPREPLHPFLIRAPDVEPVTGELAKADSPEASNDGPRTVRPQA